MRVIGNGKAVVRMLRDFGLSEYEARIYFTLLTLGEVKVTTLARRAYVPQSKAYDVLDRLIVKGFAELIDGGRPKIYRARRLGKITSKVISREERFIKKLNSNFESLQKIVHALSPVYNKYGTFGLFSPNLRRWNR